jgi:glycosyltransferase involved in cell wall biosynthesis
LKRFHLRRYKAAEEKAWAKFDGIVAINREEESCVRNQLVGKSQIFYAPMGIELAKWHYAWQPSADVPRVAYYGGLASPHNQQSAMDCYTNIMPVIWQRFPNAEFWIIGSNPTSQMRNLSNFDSRVKVTGFVENVQEVLTNISVVICPWAGKYGFRSRLIEVIALGVPLVTTPDAVHGMELEDKRDVLLGINDDELATNAISLLEDKLLAHQQSRVARQTIERLYSTTSTYDKLSQDICVWLDSPRSLHKKVLGLREQI